MLLVQYPRELKVNLGFMGKFNMVTWCTIEGRQREHP